MTKQQIAFVEDYLQQSGLTFEQLQSELLDHLVCDIENMMEKGDEFDIAWAQVRNIIPKKQVKNIQNETMKILNKQMNSAKILGSFSAFLMLVSTGFKLMKWVGAYELLIIALMFFSISIIMAIRRDYVLNELRKGTGALILITSLVLAFISSIVFQILNYPLGTEVIRYGSVTLLSIVLPFMSFYFYRKGRREDGYGIIQLIRDNQAYIERSLLILIGLSAIYTISDLIWLHGKISFITPIFFMLAIVMTGLYQFGLTWLYYTSEALNEHRMRKKYLLIFSSIAIILFLFSTVGIIVPVVIRWAAVTLSYVILSGMVIVYNLMLSSDKQRYLLTTIVIFCLAYIVGNYLMNAGMMSANLNGFMLTHIYNFSVLITLIFSLVFFYKKPIFRIYMMLILSYYMFSYMTVL